MTDRLTIAMHLFAAFNPVTGVDATDPAHCAKFAGHALALADALLAAAEKPAEKPVAPDPHDFVIACLRNSGVDTTCGACVEVAFAGVTTASHTCEKPATPALPWVVRRKDSGRVIAQCEDASLADGILRGLQNADLFEVAPAAPAPATPADPDAITHLTETVWLVAEAFGAKRDCVSCEAVVRKLDKRRLGYVCLRHGIREAASAIVPVRFDAHDDARGDGWTAAHIAAVRRVLVRIDLRPGEDAGDLTARMLAAAGRSA